MLRLRLTQTESCQSTGSGHSGRVEECQARQFFPGSTDYRISIALCRGHSAHAGALGIDDVVVSKVQDGHLLWIVTANPSDRLSLVYRGNDWKIQYAVARGARLASGRGGSLWYTSDETATLEYLETFRRDRPLGVAMR